MRVAGVMSGTSLDGIDVAIVEVSESHIEMAGFQFTPYDLILRLALKNPLNTAQISRLNFSLGKLYAEAVLSAEQCFGRVQLIGCHGQTIFHEGGSNSLQIGEAAVIAELTGAPVVSNFRARDIAAGGEGAPLVPFVDYLLFRHPKRTSIALNIGGIANVTIIPGGGDSSDVVAFDTGPGNMVIDALASEFTEGRQQYDRDGRIAASGHINKKLLRELLRGSYYKRPAPKSAGREQFGASFVKRLKQTGLSLPDLIATATALTASSIARALDPPLGSRLIVSGGGIHNPQLMAQIAAFLPGVEISSTADFGINPDAKEAVAFAVLAYYTWQRKPANLPSATGASHPVILGDLTL
ncbi:MAG: anhydro-N-acetylmuramic acid kinase [Acidobacteriia bacterium]|nr:anhydro-N-acetylmuramic acid kinase [Terriglobia bacterium]